MNKNTKNQLASIIRSQIRLIKNTKSQKQIKDVLKYSIRDRKQELDSKKRRLKSQKSIQSISHHSNSADLKTGKRSSLSRIRTRLFKIQNSSFCKSTVFEKGHTISNPNSTKKIGYSLRARSFRIPKNSKDSSIRHPKNFNDAQSFNKLQQKSNHFSSEICTKNISSEFQIQSKTLKDDDVYKSDKSIDNNFFSEIPKNHKAPFNNDTSIINNNLIVSKTTKKSKSKKNKSILHLSSQPHSKKGKGKKSKTRKNNSSISSLKTKNSDINGGGGVVTKESWCEFLFFTRSSQLFSKASKQDLKESDLFDLAPQMLIKNTVKYYDYKQSLQQSSMGWTLLLLSRWDLFLSAVLLIMTQSIGVALPHFIAQFIRSLDKIERLEEARPIAVSSAWILSLVVFSYLKSILNEHAKKVICRITTRTGQCLRGIFYSHILTSNYSFLKNVDASFISKMSVSEFDSIIKFMSNVPRMIAFPFPFMLTVLLIVLQVGKVSLVVLVTFLAAGLIHALTDHSMIGKQNTYKKVGSLRIRILTEVMKDLSTLKMNSFEEVYLRKLKQIRRREVKSLNILSTQRAFSNSILILVPLLSACLIIFLVHIQEQRDIDVILSLTIVSSLNILKNPLKVASMMVDLYMDFQIGHKSLDNFFSKVKQKPEQRVIQSSDLQMGEVRIFDCTGVIEHSLKSHSVIQSIFHTRKVIKNRQKIDIFKNKNSLESTILSTQPTDSISKVIKRTRSSKRKNTIFDRTKPAVLEQITSAIKHSRTKIDSNGNIMLHMDTTFNAKPGEKVCLMGDPAGAATGILLTIMEETQLVQGFSETLGNFSYLNLKNSFFMAQQNLKKNIILDQPFNRARYDRVLEVCQLNPSNFKGGDQIEVIENGLNFSKDERNKIILARFLYSERDIYLMDSYFDERNQINANYHYELIINNFLKEKTVIFLANSEAITKKADKIYIFEQGSVVESGTYLEVSSSKNKFYEKHVKKQFPSMYRMKSNKVGEALLLQKWSNTMEADKYSRMAHKRLYEVSSQLQKEGTKQQKGLGDILPQLMTAIANHSRKVVEGRLTAESEEYTKQNLFWLLYKYVTVTGKKNLLAMLFITVIFVVGLMTPDIWLGLWSAKTFKTQNLSFIDYLLMYGALSVLSGVAVFLRDIIFCLIIRRNSDKLHDMMLLQFFNTKMKWFLKNPSSKSIFRMSLDQIRIDSDLNKTLERAIDSFLMVVAGFFILNFTFFGAFILVTISSFLYIYCKLVKYFRVTEKLSQIHANKLAKLQGMYNRAMTDVLNYRSLCMLKALRDDFFQTSDSFQVIASHINNFSKRWLGMKIALLKTALLAVPVLLTLAMKIFVPEFTERSSWRLALALTWSIKLVDNLELFIWQFTHAILLAVSVGRVLTYSRHPDIEWKQKDKDRIKEHKWISQEGEEIDVPSSSRGLKPHQKYIFSIQNLSLKLGGREVLKNISIKIQHRKRIAIFGNPSSGKHQLMYLLFGIHSHSKGKIEFFGKDTQQFSPKKIREFGFYLKSNPHQFGSDIKQSIDPDSKTQNSDIAKILHYLGIFEQFRANIEHLKEIEQLTNLRSQPLNSINLALNASKIHNRQFELGVVPKNKKNKISNFQDDLASKIMDGLTTKMIVGDQFDREEQLNMPIDPKIEIQKRYNEERRFPHSGALKQKRKRSLSIIPDLKSEKEDDNCSSNFLKIKATSLNPGMSDRQICQAIREQKIHDFEIDLENKYQKQQSSQSQQEKRGIFGGFQQQDLEIIENFLEMKIVNLGLNIPLNIRKLLQICAALIKIPEFLFFDEKALQIGNKPNSSWDKMFKKMDYVLRDSTIFGIIDTASHIENFDYLIYMEGGEIIEHGDTHDLLRDRSTRLSQVISQRRTNNKDGGKHKSEGEMSQDSVIIDSGDNRDARGSNFGFEDHDMDPDYAVSEGGGKTIRHNSTLTTQPAFMIENIKSMISQKQMLKLQQQYYEGEELNKAGQELDKQLIEEEGDLPRESGKASFGEIPRVVEDPDGASIWSDDSEDESEAENGNSHQDKEFCEMEEEGEIFIQQSRRVGKLEKDDYDSFSISHCEYDSQFVENN